jgi:hypothetical protein
VLGIKPSAASNRHVRALKHLRDVLKSTPGFFDKDSEAKVGRLGRAVPDGSGEPSYIRMPARTEPRRLPPTPCATPWPPSTRRRRPCSTLWSPGSTLTRRSSQLRLSGEAVRKETWLSSRRRPSSSCWRACTRAGRSRGEFQEQVGTFQVFGINGLPCLRASTLASAFSRRCLSISRYRVRRPMPRSSAAWTLLPCA